MLHHHSNLSGSIDLEEYGERCPHCYVDCKKPRYLLVATENTIRSLDHDNALTGLLWLEIKAQKKLVKPFKHLS
jgi:hypothetical protein